MLLLSLFKQCICRIIKPLKMNHLKANYERVLEVLIKLLSDHHAPMERKSRAISNIERIIISLRAEYMDIVGENNRLRILFLVSKLGLSILFLTVGSGNFYFIRTFAP